MSEKEPHASSADLERYRFFFENVPIPIREEDLSEMKAKIDAAGFADAASLGRFLDENPDFIDECGRAIQIVDANSASIRMYGYTDRSQLKSQVLAKFGPESRAFIRKTIEEIFAGKTSGNSETAVYDSSGDRRVLHTNWSVLPGHEADYSRSVLCSVDVTEKVEMEEALRQSQKMEAIGQLSGGIAHDFNNLLAVIQGNIEHLQSKKVERAELDEILTDIYAATRRGSDLVRNMLTFSRQAELSPELVDANRLVTETERWISRAMPANVEIETVCQARLWNVEVDPNRLQSTIVNIMVNARDAMPQGGRLTLETSNARIDDGYFDDSGEAIEPGRYVLIAISDNGIGIPNVAKSRVFEPFYTSKKIGEGTGLGLSMVQGFVRQSGGAARIYSEVGTGTTVKLYFPAVERDDLTQLPPAGPAPSSTPQNNIRLLVVDDQFEVLNLLVRILSAEGYTVLPVANGDAALELFTRDPQFDLLLTDIVMPGDLQGPALAKAIRSIDDTIPVVFLTGYAAEATIHGNGLRSTDIRLMKPVSRNDLLKAVSKAVSLRRSASS